MSQPVYWYDSTTYGQSAPLTTSWVYYSFGFTAREMVVLAPEYSNSDPIFFSQDGVNILGRLNPQDSMINLPKKRWTGIWLKGQAGGENFRLWAY